MRLAQRLGRYGAVTQLVFACVLGGVASLHAEPTAIQRGPVLLALFALPGVVGWIGADRRRPGLVAAAAVSSGFGSFIAFSGVTLIFLLATVLFVASAIGLAVPATGEPRGGLVSGAAQLILAGAISVLLVGAGASALLITDSACYVVHETAFGSSFEVLPWSTGEMTLPSDASRGGCSTGLLSLRGVGLGVVLAVGGMGLTSAAARRRSATRPGTP